MTMCIYNHIITSKFIITYKKNKRYLLFTKHNPYYNKHTQKTEFEYILSLNDFSLLKSHSDEFSTPAVHYLEKYQEPTYLQVQLRQQYKNQDLSEVLKEFEDTNAHEEVM